MLCSTLDQWAIYSGSRVSGPDCTLHIAITHVITVLGRWSLTHYYARLQPSNTVITSVITVCNVQLVPETLKPLYYIFSVKAKSGMLSPTSCPLLPPNYHVAGKR